jgi:hypothetical protein
MQIEHLDTAIDVRSEPLDDADRIARAAQGLAMGSVEETSEEGGWASFKRFLTGTSLAEGSRTRQRMRWPLFFLGCPAADGAELEVAFAAETTRARGWNLRLFGSGFDRVTSISVADTHQATAGAGEQRLVFLDQDVDVVHYALLRHGHPPIEGSRLEIVAGTEAVGVLDLGAALWAWRAPAKTVLRLPYRGAAAASRQEWTREQVIAQTSDLILGLDSGAISIGRTLSYQMITTVTLRAALPGGVDWDVLGLDRCPGIVVQEERP